MEEHKKIVLKHQIKDNYEYDEAIKTLRTNIQFSGSNIRTVMLTSAMPDEGKSDISFATAQSFAQIGKKTILVDADIRKSVLLSRYQINQEVFGLSQYLSEQKTLDDVIYDTNIDNLSVIFAGPYSPDPARLFAEEICRTMFERLREMYDYIIIDTPPMAALIDGAIIAHLCDGAVLVIENEAISYRLEQKIKSQLEKSGCRILGVVLNKVDMHRGTYYGKYGHYGRYGRYERYDKYGSK